MANMFWGSRDFFTARNASTPAWDREDSTHFLRILPTVKYIATTVCMVSTLNILQCCIEKIDKRSFPEQTLSTITMG